MTFSELSIVWHWIRQRNGEVQRALDIAGKPERKQLRLMLLMLDLWQARLEQDMNAAREQEKQP